MFRGFMRCSSDDFCFFDFFRLGVDVGCFAPHMCGFSMIFLSEVDAHNLVDFWVHGGYDISD